MAVCGQMELFIFPLHLCVLTFEKEKPVVRVLADMQGMFGKKVDGERMTIPLYALGPLCSVRRSSCLGTLSISKHFCKVKAQKYFTTNYVSQTSQGDLSKAHSSPPK